MMTQVQGNHKEKLKKRSFADSHEFFPFVKPRKRKRIVLMRRFLQDA